MAPSQVGNRETVRKSEAELERTDGTESSRKPRELLGTVSRECFSLYCLVRRCNFKKRRVGAST